MPSLKSYYSPEQIRLARIAKALSNPIRVYIMDYLADNLDKCCYSGEMIDDLPIARSTLSGHLKELKRAGLIQGEIKPPFIKYCINRDNWEEAQRLMSAFFKR